jgi:hypothetical protein
MTVFQNYKKKEDYGMIKMTMSKKEIKRIIKAIESVGVEVIEYTINKHNKFRVKNPATGTTKLIIVSGSPRAKGIYHEVKSSVRKVFRKDGEEL